MAAAAPLRRYVVDTHRLFRSPSQTAVSISRMDGRPASDRNGESFRQDHACFLTEDEAVERVRALIRSLPNY